MAYASIPNHEPIELMDGSSARILRASCGSPVKILSIKIERKGYIPDVYVRVQSPRDGRLLAEDETFCKGVMRLLRKAGYAGPEFGRAELGMQTENCVALEPCRSFYAFARSKGFVDLGWLEQQNASKSDTPDRGISL